MKRILLLLCLLVGTAIAQAEALNDHLTELEQVAEFYTTESQKKPTNAGAKKMAATLESAAAALKNYLAGGLKRDEAMTTIASAIDEAKRYPTENARKALTLLKEIKTQLSNMPEEQTLNNVAAPEEVKELEKESQKKTDEKLSVKSTSADGLEKTLVYTLFALYLLAIILLALILTGVYRKRLKKLKAEVAELRQMVEDLDFSRQDPTAFATVVQEDLKKRWDRLENNTVSFIGEVEDQIKALRDQLDQSGGGQASPPAAWQAVVTRVEMVETRLEQLSRKPEHPLPEAFVPSKSEATPPAIPPVVAPSAATQPEQTVATVAEVVTAPEAETDLKATARRAIAWLPDGTHHHEWIEALTSNKRDMVPVRPLAELLQDAYLNGLKVNDMGVYQQLVSSADGLNLIAEDQMAGRMSFSDFYADNLPLDRFRLEDTDVLPGLPNARIVEMAETQPQYGQAVKNTVLLTLRPTIMQIQEGAKTVLSRGLYVVQS